MFQLRRFWRSPGLIESQITQSLDFASVCMLLIICFNFAGFGGRLVSSSLKLPSPWILRAFACCFVAFVGVVLLYITDTPSFLEATDNVNLGIMMVFVFAAFIQGMSMVWGSEFGQGLADGHSNVD